MYIHTYTYIYTVARKTQCSVRGLFYIYTVKKNLKNIYTVARKTQCSVRGLF